MKNGEGDFIDLLAESCGHLRTSLAPTIHEVSVFGTGAFCFVYRGRVGFLRTNVAIKHLEKKDDESSKSFWSLVPLAGLNDELWCQGIDGVASRSAAYYQLGAQFAKCYPEDGEEN